MPQSGKEGLRRESPLRDIGNSVTATACHRTNGRRMPAANSEEGITPVVNVNYHIRGAAHTGVIKQLAVSCDKGEHREFT